MKNNFNDENYEIEEAHGQINDVFCITNRETGNMLLLDLYENNNIKPIIFDTEKDAEAFVDREIPDEASKVYIEKLNIIFFNHGAYKILSAKDNI